MSLNFKLICRLCLKENETLMPIFSELDDDPTSSLPAKISTFVPSVKITVDDGLPDKVCLPCALQAVTSYKFKIQCENSDATLRKLHKEKEQNNPENEIQDTLSETEREQRSKVAIKPEVKEEMSFHENNAEEEINNDGLYENDFSESSNEPWPDFQQEPTSSKKDDGSNVTLKKKQKGTCKINVKRKKKSFKEESSGTAESAEEPRFALEAEEMPLDVKIEENNSINKELNTKLRVKKSNYMKIFQCHDCGKNFAKKAQLVLHMSDHTGSKPYICNQCCRTFASRINLKKHLFTHTGQKPYLCTHCGVFFGRIDTLTKHMRSHTGEKPFNCNVCGNSFARRSTFTNHMRTHSGEKPYLCTECGWRCVQSYDLKKHMRCHTGEKPYHCSVCRMSFGQRNSLTKHMRCHVGEMPISMECVKDMQFKCQVYGPKEYGSFPVPNSQTVDGHVQ